MKRQTKILVVPTEQNATEVIDSIKDLLKSAIKIESTLKDGFQFNDLFTAISIQPDVTEIVNDAPIFWEQLSKLRPAFVTQAVLTARAELVRERYVFGKVSNFVISFLFLTANNYQFAMETYIGARNQLTMWQTLIKGENIFPVV